MSFENSPNEELTPFHLSQFESFEQGETHTRLTLLLSLQTYIDIMSDFNSLTTPEERHAMMTASIQYALLSTRIDGFRIEKNGYITSTILPEDLQAPQRRIIQAPPDQARSVTTELYNKQADAIKQIAQDNNCLMGDVLTVGTDIRRSIKYQHAQDNKIIAVLTNSDEQLAILPLS